MSNQLTPREHKAASTVIAALSDRHFDFVKRACTALNPALINGETGPAVLAVHPKTRTVAGIIAFGNGNVRLTHAVAQYRPGLETATRAARRKLGLPKETP